VVRRRMVRTTAMLSCSTQSRSASVIVARSMEQLGCVGIKL
jgi:hypothetical protein